MGDGWGLSNYGMDFNAASGFAQMQAQQLYANQLMSQQAFAQFAQDVNHRYDTAKVKALKTVLVTDEVAWLRGRVKEICESWQGQ